MVFFFSILVRCELRRLRSSYIVNELPSFARFVKQFFFTTISLPTTSHLIPGMVPLFFNFHSILEKKITRYLIFKFSYFDRRSYVLLYNIYSKFRKIKRHCQYYMVRRMKIMTCIKEFTLRIQDHERGNLIFFFSLRLTVKFNKYLSIIRYLQK